MSSQTQRQTSIYSQPADRWYREPMVWLVWGGPAVVVIASFVTLGLAIKYGDEPLATASGGAEVVVKSQQALLPAMQARNHAAEAAVVRSQH